MLRFWFQASDVIIAFECFSFIHFKKYLAQFLLCCYCILFFTLFVTIKLQYFSQKQNFQYILHHISVVAFDVSFVYNKTHFSPARKSQNKCLCFLVILIYLYCIWYGKDKHEIYSTIIVIPIQSFQIKCISLNTS